MLKSLACFLINSSGSGSSGHFPGTFTYMHKWFLLFPPFTESTGNRLPLYWEEKQPGGVSRMEKQSLLLSTPSKSTCHCHPVCKSNGDLSCMLNTVCRAERDFAARENAWQVQCLEI